MAERLPPTTWEQLVGFLSVLAIWLIPAGFGRAAWYTDQLRKGRVKMSLTMIVAEACTAVLMAIIAGGIGDYFQFQPLWTMAFIGLVSWLGPNGTYALLRPIVESWLSRGAPKG